MHRKTLVATLSAVLICGGSSLAFAQNAPPPPAPAATSAQNAPSNHMMRHESKPGAHGMHGKHHWRGRHAHGHHGRHSPAIAVIGTLGRLEHLYKMQGKTGRIESMYRNVLEQTQNPQVRHFAYDHLARAQMQPKNASAAIATLNKDLDESLKQLNQRDQMRSKWRAKMMQSTSH